MNRFIEQGMDSFYLVLNYKSSMIKSYFEEVKSKNKLKYIQEEESLGTAGGLKLLPARMAGTFLVTNCDVIIDTNYSEILRFHEENKYDMTMVVSCRHFVIPYGVCEIVNKGTLKSIKEKPEYDLLVNTGMYLLNKKILGLIPKNKFLNMTDVISKAKAKGYKIGAFPVNEKSWIDIGQWEEYQKAIKVLGG